MEIQSFTLCQAIQWTKGRPDAEGIFGFGYNYEGHEYPVKDEIAFAALLRREKADEEEKVVFRMNLFTRAGERLGEPQQMKVPFTFAKEYRFGLADGKIPFTFPQGGWYRLVLTGDADDAPPLYSYEFLVVGGE